MNLETGAFGDPTNPSTLILFWQKMEMLHYPGASETRAYLEEEMQRQQIMAAQAADMQMRMQQMQMDQKAAEATAIPAAAGSVDNPEGKEERT